jgi:CubicO group peptidase (beta-lactamase class C family)
MSPTERSYPGKATRARGRLRRWFRRLAVGFAAVVLLVGAVFGWAWASVDRSTMARAMWWMDADVDDQFRFPARTIRRGDDTSPIPSGDELDPEALPVLASVGGSGFDGFLNETDTLAFLVVHQDQLVYERYLNGADRLDRQTSFSVAKSFLSTLVGIAIDEGLIESVDDPVSDYVPELAERDPRFARITLRDLLSMSSGLRYKEHDLPLPWGDDIATYYGVDLREVALNDTEIVGPPGEAWLYNNYNPLLLGMVVERATGCRSRATCRPGCGDRSEPRPTRPGAWTRRTLGSRRWRAA